MKFPRINNKASTVHLVSTHWLYMFLVSTCLNLLKKIFSPGGASTTNKLLLYFYILNSFM